MPSQTIHHKDKPRICICITLQETNYFSHMDLTSVKCQTCGMLLKRRMWSDRVDPGKTSPPIAIPDHLK